MTASRQSSTGGFGPSSTRRFCAGARVVFAVALAVLGWPEPRLAAALNGPALPEWSQASAVQPQENSADKQEKESRKDQPQETPLSLPKGKKLYLKDGNFHLVRSYERKGDRVRYYSVERSAWEEIPAELVDWEATAKAEAEAARRDQELTEKLRAQIAAERTAELDVDASIEVAPGTFLPGGEGLYVVEGRAVVPLTQASADVKLDKGRLLTQVLVPIPVVPTRHKVQISGKRATHRIEAAQPEFYVRTAEAQEPEMELIRAQVKGDVRQLEFLNTTIIGTQTSERKSISIQRWKVAKGVYRLTLSQPLEPGEYALAEILPEGMNLFVWDFGVDAPAHPTGASDSTRGPAKEKQ